MKQPGTPLSPTFVRTVTRPGRYGDGRGRAWAVAAGQADGERAHLEVLEPAYPHRRPGDQHRTWARTRSSRFAEARKQALANRRLIAQGRHPEDGRDRPDAHLPRGC